MPICIYLLIRRFVCLVTFIILEESSGQKVQDSISFFLFIWFSDVEGKTQAAEHETSPDLITYV